MKHAAYSTMIVQNDVSCFLKYNYNGIFAIGHAIITYINHIIMCCPCDRRNLKRRLHKTINITNIKLTKLKIKLILDQVSQNLLQSKFNPKSLI